LSGRVFDVQRFSLHDGPGIRTVVFLKGCPLRCSWCANPESQRAEAEIAWFVGRQCALCGRCAVACMCEAIRVDDGRVLTDRRLMGRQVTIDEVMAEVRRDAVFFRRSGGGVTFSGGEPLAQPGFLLECLRRCRRWGYHTAVETCGQAGWEDLREAALFTDLFLYDLKQLDSARHRTLTGQGNELILGNLERLLGLGVAVTVRVPVVPGANDDRESLSALAGFVARHRGIRSVELLPYHPLGLHKYDALDVAWSRVEKPDPAGLEAMAAYVAEVAAGVDCVVTRGLG